MISFFPMKRKIAFLWGYCGITYSGIQFNNEINTLEKKLIDILCKLQYISEKNAESAQKIKMKSASRTDKGVSAIFNVTICKINQELTENINQILKNEFSKAGFILYNIARVPKTFIPYRSARSREYKYFIPIGVLNKNIAKSQIDIMQSSENYNISIEKFKHDTFEWLNKSTSNTQIIDKLNFILNLFHGNHDFHNFTTQNVQGTTIRYIKHIYANSIKKINGIEYVEVFLHGDSFIMHQIRKMIAFAIFICRNYDDNTIIEQYYNIIFSKNNYYIPKAPSEYLYLYNIHFDDFNKRTPYEKLSVDYDTIVNFETFIQSCILTTQNLSQWIEFIINMEFKWKNVFYLNNKKEF